MRYGILILSLWLPGCFLFKSHVQSESHSAETERTAAAVFEKQTIAPSEIELQGEMIQAPAFGQPARKLKGIIKIRYGKVEVVRQAEKTVETAKAADAKAEGTKEFDTNPGILTSIGALVAAGVVVFILWQIFKPRAVV